MWRTAKLTLACLAVLTLFAVPVGAEDQAEPDSNTSGPRATTQTSVDELIEQWREERMGQLRERGARDGARTQLRTGDRNNGIAQAFDQQGEVIEVICEWWMWWCQDGEIFSMDHEELHQLHDDFHDDQQDAHDAHDAHFDDHVESPAAPY